MESNRTRLALVAAFIAFYAIGAIQGSRVTALRDTESFYRWILSASILSRAGEPLEIEDTSEKSVEAMDDELFEKVVALAEETFVDVPIEEGDRDDEGNHPPSLLRAARQDNDALIYSLASSPDAKPLVAEFSQHLRAGLLDSAGTQFSTASLYERETRVEGVGLTSLFFGFRKVAANFLWLEVDKYWHSGQMHRMLPVMHTTVALDPSFVEAYLMGAWHVAYNVTAQLPETPEPQKKFHPRHKKLLGIKEEWYYVGVDFLKDGIRKNPRDYRLYFDLGYTIFENKLNDHPNAVLYLDEARRYQHDRWVPRMLYLAMWRNGQYGDAIEGWKEYQMEFPQSPQAKRFIPINQGYLAEAKAEQAAECGEAATKAQQDFMVLAQQARAAGDEAAAANYSAQAQDAERVAGEMKDLYEQEWLNAGIIWAAMIQETQDATALARVLRRKAIQFAEDGRHLEAMAELDVARYEMLESFDELSELLIEIKLEGNLPLTVSEKLAIARKEEAAKYRTDDGRDTWRYIDCDYLETGV